MNGRDGPLGRPFPFDLACKCLDFLELLERVSVERWAFSVKQDARLPK
jgi:hypothetical protein